MLGPLQVLDGLVKGIVLVAYDFVRLTVVGLVLPLIAFLRLPIIASRTPSIPIAATRRVWLYVRSADRRISSLTYLVLWILLAVSLFSESGGRLAQTVAGLTKTPDVQIPALLAAVLLIAMVVDVSIRASLWSVHNRIRRQLYESLARVAVANIFFGMTIIVAVESYRIANTWTIFGPLPALFWNGRLPQPLSYNTPYLLLFSISLGVVMVKGLVRRNWKGRAYVALPIIFLAPALLVNGSVYLYAGVLTIKLFAPERPTLTQQFTRCTFSAEKIRATALLRVRGSGTFAVDPHDLGIYDGSSRYVGRGDEGQPLIAVSDRQFTPITFAATFDSVQVHNPPGSKFDCELKLFDVLSDAFRPVEDAVLPPSKGEPQ